MTNEDFLRTQLERSLQERGENAFSVRMLRQQLESLLWEKNHPDNPLNTHLFHIGARREASEDLRPGEYREDMYGNPILSPEERVNRRSVPAEAVRERAATTACALCSDKEDSVKPPCLNVTYSIFPLVKRPHLPRSGRPTPSLTGKTVQRPEPTPGGVGTANRLTLPPDAKRLDAGG
jgi:hypothetical protein